MTKTDQHTSTQKSSERTLLASVLLSAPGPLVVGLGLIVGQSSTQMADFFRRSCELLAIICAYIIYRTTTKNGLCDEKRKRVLERRANMFIGAMMGVAGCITLALATVLVLPGTQLAATVDLFGSIIVSVYLVYCGVKTIREAL